MIISYKTKIGNDISFFIGCILEPPIVVLVNKFGLPFRKFMEGINKKDRQKYKNQFDQF
jgi:hypothetical protein